MRKLMYINAAVHHTIYLYVVLLVSDCTAS